MYRSAPSTALFQGDILVVPFVTTGSPTPDLISEDADHVPITCKKCKAEVAPAPPGICPKCRRPMRRKRFGTVNQRIARKEEIFATQDAQGVVAQIKLVAAVILSDGCDIDDSAFLSLAPVQPMSEMEPAYADRVRGGKSYNMLPLPATENLPECAVNFDMKYPLAFDNFGVYKAHLSERVAGHVLVPYAEVLESRVASLDEEGLTRLLTGGVRHMTRAEVQPIAPKPDVFYLHPSRPTDCPKRNWSWPRPAWLRRAMAAA